MGVGFGPGLGFGLGFGVGAGATSGAGATVAGRAFTATTPPAAGRLVRTAAVVTDGRERVRGATGSRRFARVATEGVWALGTDGTLTRISGGRGLLPSVGVAPDEPGFTSDWTIDGSSSAPRQK